MSDLSEKVRLRYHDEMNTNDKRPSEAMEIALSEIQFLIRQLREIIKKQSDDLARHKEALKEEML